LLYLLYCVGSFLTWYLGIREKDLKEAYEKALIAMETAQNEVTKAESDLELAGKIAAEAEVNLKAVQVKS